MAHYEMYICLKKTTYESTTPSILQSKLGWFKGISAIFSILIGWIFKRTF